MSNKVGFNQIRQYDMLLPAGKPEIFVNGQLCDLLSVTKIVRAEYPEFSWAELIYNPAVARSSQYIEPEDIEYILPIGSPVKIYYLYNSNHAAVSVSRYLLFTGYIENVDKEIKDRNVRIKFKAMDVSAKLERIKITGKRFEDFNRDVFLGDAKLIFNADGQPDRSKYPITRNGLSYHIFSYNKSCSFRFDCYQAINYLLCEYVTNGIAVLPDIRNLAAITNNAVLTEFNVDGLSVIDAINKLCSDIGINYIFVPCQNEHSPDVSMEFYAVGNRRTVELNRQYDGDSFSVSKTNIHTMNSKEYSWFVTQRFIGRGEKKEYEATFSLAKAWDPAKEGLSIESYSTSYDGFGSVENVYRKWCLNEAGEYTQPPYNQGDVFDFQKIFGTEKYLHKNRKFKDCISTDSNGDSLGVYLEVSYDEGFSWTKYEGSFKVFSDECGVWISDSVFDETYWAAVQSSSLKLRVTAVVESDEHLSCSIANGPVNSSAEVVDNVVKLSEKYHFRKITSESIFYNNALAGATATNEEDDTQALLNVVRKQANVADNTVEQIDITTPMISVVYEPGDKVTVSPDSKDILGIRRDSFSHFWIAKVEMDFEKQRTKLKVLHQRKYTL